MKKTSQVRKGPLYKQRDQVKELLSKAFDALHESIEFDRTAAGGYAVCMFMNDLNLWSAAGPISKFNVSLTQQLTSGFRDATPYPANLDGTYHRSFFEAARAITVHRSLALERLYDDDERGMYSIPLVDGVEEAQFPPPKQLEAVNELSATHSAEAPPFVGVLDEYYRDLSHNGCGNKTLQELDSAYLKRNGPFHLHHACMELIKEAERAIGEQIEDAVYSNEYDRYVFMGITNLDDLDLQRLNRRTRDAIWQFANGKKPAQVSEILGISADNARQINSRYAEVIQKLKSFKK